MATLGDSWRHWTKTGVTGEHLFVAYVQSWAIGVLTNFNKAGN